MMAKSRLYWRVLSSLVSITVFSGVLGCASSARKTEPSDRAVLAQPPLGGRTLASGTELETELSEEALQRYFVTLWNDKEPAQEILRSLRQLVKVYYRAERQMRIFDRELDGVVKKKERGGKVLPSISSYPKMLAYWEVSHRAMQRIAYVYDRLLEIRTTQPKDSDDYKKAHETLNVLSQYFYHAQGADRLALNELSTELKPIFDRYAMQVKVPQNLEQLNSFSNTLFEQGEKISDFVRRPEIQQEISQKIQIAQPVDPSDNDSGGIENVVDQFTYKIRDEIEQMSEISREPQGEGPRFFPSSGKHGSISGLEYPKGTWSITFDDGPSAKYTPRILDNLKEYGLQSTFFELAMNVKAQPKASLAVLDAGMELGNHSYTHPQLPKVTDAALKHELVDSTEVETEIWGERHRPKLFRCPYGAGLTVKRIREKIASLGFVHVFWSVDTLDWQDKNPESILARAKKQMLAEGRGIILFHDIHPQSVEASRRLMAWIKKQGYRHETVGAMIDELNRTSSSQEKSENHGQKAQ